MADVTDVLAIPFPEGGDTFAATAVQGLAERVDEAPGIESLTAAEIAALTSAQKPAGRVVYNSDTSKLQVSNGTSFADLPYLLLAGGTMAGAIAMGSNKVTGLAKGTATGEAVARQQVQSGTVASAAGGYVDVTFSPAFASAPTVVATPNASGTFGSPGYLYVTSVTTSGARIYGLSLSMGCTWIAVGD